MNAMARLAAGENAAMHRQTMAGDSQPRPRIEPPRYLTIMASLIHEAANAHRVSADDILGKSRKAHLVDARMDIVTAARDLGLTLEPIGRALHRHHTSIQNLERRAERRAAQ